MKELWILNHYAVSPEMSGGTRHYDFAKELSQRGYNVTVFASGFHYASHRELKLTKGESWKIEEINGVRFVWIKTTPYQKNDLRRVVNMVSFMWRGYWTGRGLASRRLTRPDVVLGSSVHLLTVLSAQRLAKYHKARFIMEVRDLWPQSIVDMGLLSDRNPVTWALRALEKFLYRRAERIITLMPRAEEYISKLGIPKAKILPIPNGVDLAPFEIGQKIEPNLSFNVFYIGSHGPSNGLAALLHAAKILHDRGFDRIKLCLMGEGVDKERLKALGAELALNNVEFLNAVPKTEVPKYSMRADALLHIEVDFGASKYGGSPNKIYDYMAAGKPIVVASNWVGATLEKIGCGVMASASDPESIADAIIKVYQLPANERAAMGGLGRRFVENHHSIPVLVDKLEAVINGVSGAPQEPIGKHE